MEDFLLSKVCRTSQPLWLYFIPEWSANIWKPGFMNEEDYNGYVFSKKKPPKPQKTDI